MMKTYARTFGFRAPTDFQAQHRHEELGLQYRQLPPNRQLKLTRCPSARFGYAKALPAAQVQLNGVLGG